jgi:hypothetical protein
MTPERSQVLLSGTVACSQLCNSTSCNIALIGMALEYCTMCTASYVLPPCLLHPVYCRYLVVYVSEGCRPQNRLYYLDLDLVPKHSDAGTLDFSSFDFFKGGCCGCIWVEGSMVVPVKTLISELCFLLGLFCGRYTSRPSYQPGFKPQQDYAVCTTQQAASHLPPEGRGTHPLPCYAVPPVSPQAASPCPL